jgi:hypothetical protein
VFIIDLINNVFEPIKFQAQETLIHILYTKLGELVLKLMSRIFGVDELFHDEDTCKTMDQLLDLDFQSIQKLELVDKLEKIAKLMDNELRSTDVLRMNNHFRTLILTTYYTFKKGATPNKKFCSLFHALILMNREENFNIAIGKKQTLVGKQS